MFNVSAITSSSKAINTKVKKPAVYVEDIMKRKKEIAAKLSADLAKPSPQFQTNKATSRYAELNQDSV
jgi:hypothetical protein